VYKYYGYGTIVGWKSWADSGLYNMAPCLDYSYKKSTPQWTSYFPNIAYSYTAIYATQFGVKIGIVINGSEGKDWNGNKDTKALCVKKVKNSHGNYELEENWIPSVGLILCEYY
jgi:hypothetical protein